VRRRLLELDISGATTEVPALTGVPAADVLVPNDEDLSYAKLRLDPRSMSNVVSHIAGLDSPLARALCWAAAWDMVRDAELPTRDYLALVATGLPREADINLVTTTLLQAQSALTAYADPAFAPTGWQQLADTARAAFTEAKPGSGLQLAWVRGYATAARTSDDLALLAAWRAGRDVPAGLAVDTDLRWTLLNSLVAAGLAGPTEIEAELDRDRTASGERAAALAGALIPTSESKADSWRRLTAAQPLPNWLHRALLLGFHSPRQPDLTSSYVSKYFDVIAEIWSTRDSESAQEFVTLAFPGLQISEPTVAATEAWLARSDQPAPLRRLVAEGRDALVRAIAARACDGA
jgi:aminopeptidase N